MDELQKKIKKKETITVENLWQVIESHQGETFLTVKAPSLHLHDQRRRAFHRPQAEIDHPQHL